MNAKPLRNSSSRLLGEEPVPPGSALRAKRKRLAVLIYASYYHDTPVSESETPTCAASADKGGNEEVVDVSKVPLFCRALASLVRSFGNQEGSAERVLYIGYDYGDPLYDDDATQSQVTRLAREVTGSCVADVRLLGEENPVKSPAFVWNNLLRRAGAEGADYFFNMFDDTVVLTPGWDEAYMRAIDSAPNGVGAAAPLDTSLREIAVHICVGRAHYEAFERLFLSDLAGLLSCAVCQLAYAALAPESFRWERPAFSVQGPQGLDRRMSCGQAEDSVHVAHRFTVMLNALSSKTHTPPRFKDLIEMQAATPQKSPLFPLVTNLLSQTIIGKEIEAYFSSQQEPFA